MLQVMSPVVNVNEAPAAKGILLKIGLCVNTNIATIVTCELYTQHC